MSIKFILIGIAFFLIYFGFCFYVGCNGWVWLNRTFSFKYKRTYFSLVLVLSLSMFLGRNYSLPIFELIGYMWLVLLGFSMIILPIANLLYLFLKKKGLKWIGTGALLVYVFIFTYGSFNAWSPVVRTYDITINKEINSKQKDLKILMAADIHLSNIIRNNHLQKLVNISNEMKPDIILLPGDVMNDDIEPILKYNMMDTMKGLKAPLGVYVSLGNHEYYGSDVSIFIEEMEKIGITVLTDEIETINDSFYLIGRRDDTETDRKTYRELLKGIDNTKPLIVLDHQPKEFNQARESNIDLVVSGHTHRGQIAPGNFITQKLFENDWGLLKDGSFHSIVTSGFGTWGPPIKIGSRSEVIEINVHFK